MEYICVTAQKECHFLNKRLQESKQYPQEPARKCYKSGAQHSTPQTLKIEGYIKNKKVIVLIDSGSTHNFIHYKLAKDLNCFVYPVPEFQVMIADGGTINCSGKCNKINLTMGEYVMNSPMIAIPMGGADVVLGIQWLQSLGTMAFNFQELFMKFHWKEKKLS
jgi:hypothetical protein